MFLYLRVGFDGKIDQEVGQDCFESNFYETKNVESNRSELESSGSNWSESRCFETKDTDTECFEFQC